MTTFSTTRHYRFAAILLASVAPFAVVLAPASAQSPEARGSFDGVVIQEASGNPLPGVLVSAAGTNATATTDAQGRFRFGNLPAGAITIELRFLGYQPLTQQITVPNGETGTGQFRFGCRDARHTIQTINGKVNGDDLLSNDRSFIQLV